MEKYDSFKNMWDRQDARRVVLYMHYNEGLRISVPFYAHRFTPVIQSSCVFVFVWNEHYHGHSFIYIRLDLPMVRYDRGELQGCFTSGGKQIFAMPASWQDCERHCTGALLWSILLEGKWPQT